MKTFIYIARRLLLAIPQMFLISIVTFTLIRMLPGDPARLQLGPLVSDETVLKLRHEMRLDEPLPVQYFAYIEKLIRGDLGRSWTNNTYVLDDIIKRLPSTLELLTLGLLVILLVLIPIGAITASRSGGLITRTIRRITFGYGFLSGAIPDFWFGLLLIFIFFTLLGVAPGPVGRIGILATPPPRVTGFYTIDSLVAGDWATFLDVVKHLVLPVLTLALVYGGAILKMTQVTVGNALRSDYTAFMEGLGLPHRKVLILALRNSAPPIIVMTGLVVGFLLGGAVLIETVFNLNGLGQYAVQAISSADYAPIQAFVLVAAFFTMLVYLAVDLLYFAVDPRVRSQSSGDIES